MANKCVVRNQAYRSGEFGIRERHNERKNEEYGNGDIIPGRSYLNVHFKQCEGTYKNAFDKLLADGVISMRGLGKDPKVFDELVFDVNTAYFEERGGYDYAKQFFEEAYKLAVKEAGGEQYVLSAVMHADERNKAISEKLGHDVFHYHLHVAYIPVVDKEIKWSKRCKDPALVGTTKEVIKQVSHSKRWPREIQLDKNGEMVRNGKGKAVLLNSYSLLQDRFFAHMRESGFTDFERGEQKSTAVHLETLDYKIQQDKQVIAALEKTVVGKKQRAADLDGKMQKQKERLSSLGEKLTVTKQAAITFDEIDGMVKKTLLGKVELTPYDWKTVSDLAKEGVLSRINTPELKKKLAAIQKDAKLTQNAFNRLLDETQELREAQERFPDKTKDFLQTLHPTKQKRQQRQPGHEHER